MEGAMEPLTRITIDPEVMGGKPCIRGIRVTVGTIVGLMPPVKLLKISLRNTHTWNMKM